MKFIKILFTIGLVSLYLQANEIRINFQNTPIEDVVKFIAKKKKLNILLNEPISGNINFISNKPLDEDELIPFLEHILMVKGYALSPRSNGFIEVIRATTASKEVTFNQNNSIGMKMVVLRPKYIKPSVVASKIKHLSSQYALITFDDKMNLLLISDYPRNIKSMKELIRLFDTHLKRDLKRVVFTYYNVGTALKKLKTIFDATSENYDSDIKLMADSFQNAIWISANSSDMDKAVKFMKAFDSQAKDVAMMQTKILFLKNANVEDVLKTAQEIAKSKDIDKPIKSVITANKELNALIISSTANQIKDLTKLIKEIDIQRKQVFIEVRVFEVSKNNLDQLGVKWGAAGGAAKNGVIATTSINMGGSAFVLPKILATTLNMDSVNSGVALGATIDFLKNEGAINIVSQPNLLSINNQKSSIYVGKTQSIKTGDSTGANVDDTTRNSYKREDIGLTLEITPQITDKNSVALKILINYENIDKAESAAVDQPTTIKRKIDTLAIVENESSITLGGLIRSVYSTSESKVPLLGDIPLLGLLFKHKSTSYDQVSTIMVITPYIVNNTNELIALQSKLTKIKSIEHSMAKKMEAVIKKVHRKEREKEAKEKAKEKENDASF